jgi:two-component system, NarL family, response regulator DevR
MNPAKPKSIRVLLVDDSEVVRMGLWALLDGTEGIQVVGEAGGIAAAVRLAVELRPDVVLLDIRLPDGMGFDACRQILAKLPDTRILVLTSVAEEKLVDESIRAGAHGYLLKEINGQGLLKAIHDVAEGKSVLDPSITNRVLKMIRDSTKTEENIFSILSPQERRILALITQGLTNKEVAAEMKLAEKTVKNYLSTVFEKLHVSRRSQAAAIYVQQMQRSP